MSLLRRVAAAIAASSLALIATPPAFAASGIYGGSTSADEPIVLRTDAKAKKLRSAVIAWRAACTDDRSFSQTDELTRVVGEPGFTPGPDDLVMARNARGRFAGTQFAVWQLGDSRSAVVSVELSGRLKGGGASGRLRATVSILDAAASEVATCETGSLRWSASRAAGRIYGGKTSQEAPVVVRLDRKRKRVADMLVGWQTDSCQPPDSFVYIGDHFVNFTLRRARFGATFESSEPLGEGGTVDYDYDVSGTISRRSARGNLNVKLTVTDAAGTVMVSCDSGAVGWRATTG